jgi:hypothetical protein
MEDFRKKMSHIYRIRVYAVKVLCFMHNRDFPVIDVGGLHFQ